MKNSRVAMVSMIDSHIESKSKICIVGYALNPKKLRRGNSDAGDPSPRPDSARRQPQTALNLPKVGNAEITVISAAELCGSITSPRINSSAIWRGGGLADIVSIGTVYEGVQFVQWDPEIPPEEQVINFYH
jgi:hypothetical protein